MLYNVRRFAKLQVFKTNILKFIIDWQNVKIVDVRQFLTGRFIAVV